MNSSDLEEERLGAMGNGSSSNGTAVPPFPQVSAGQVRVWAMKWSGCSQQKHLCFLHRFSPSSLLTHMRPSCMGSATSLALRSTPSVQSEWWLWSRRSRWIARLMSVEESGVKSEGFIATHQFSGISGFNLWWKAAFNVVLFHPLPSMMVQNSKAYSATWQEPCKIVSSCSPASLPSSEWSKTWRNISEMGFQVEMVSQPCSQTAIAHFRSAGE